MARILYDTFAGSSWTQLTDHVGEVGAIWRPHPDYIGTLRISGTTGVVFSNPLDTDPALYYASAQLAGSLGLYLSCGLQGQGTGEVLSSGTITLTGGASGSVNTLTVNGVNILPYTVPFNTSLAITAQDVANAINSGNLGYSANNGGGTVTTIYAAPGLGTVPNGLVVNSTRTTITATHANMAGGVNGTTDNSIGVCYGVQLDDNSYYRVRHSVGTWLLEKVVNGVATTLASSATPSPGAQWSLVISVVGSVHTASIFPAPGYGYTTGAVIPATLTLTATDSSIPIAGSYFGVWGSGGGSSTGVSPQQVASKAMWLYGFSSMPDLEAGASEADITLPQVTVAGSGTAGVTGEVSLTLPMFTLISADVAVATGDGVLGTLPMFTLTGTVLTGSAVIEPLPMFTGAATALNGSVSTVVETLPAFGIASTSGPGVIATLPAFELAATAVGGAYSIVDEILPAFTLNAQAAGAIAYSAASTLPAFTSAATILPGNTATLAEALPAFSLNAAGLSGNVATLLEVLPLFRINASARSSSTNAADNTLPLLQLFAEAIQTVSDSLATSLGDAPQAWVLNLRNDALTEYTNFAFNSMTFFNGKYLGASDAGVLEIGVQSTDGGTAIAAYATTGKHDFESSFLKRLPYTYLQCEADGDLYVSKICSEDGRRDFLLRWNSNTAMQQRRVMTGRRSKSAHWQLEIGNRGGAHFRVTSCDLLGQRTNRRMQ